MNAEQIADGLKFPEALVWTDGALYVTQNGGLALDLRIGTLWRIPLGVRGLALRA